MLDAKARRVEGKKKKEEPLRFFASLPFCVEMSELC
jgi:hypothetical protein